MSPQMGRPKAENPKSKQIMVRLDAETDRKLEELAEFFKEKKSLLCAEGLKSCTPKLKNRRCTNLPQRCIFYQMNPHNHTD